MNNLKSYTDILKFNTFKERFEYLKYGNHVGYDNLGHDRYLCQDFYASKEWKKIRDRIIVRDNGCEFGLEDHPIKGKIIVHHMNILTVDDFLNHTDFLINGEYLICMSNDTHNLIHFGKESPDLELKERYRNDTAPWRLVK